MQSIFSWILTKGMPYLDREGDVWAVFCEWTWLHDLLLTISDPVALVVANLLVAVHVYVPASTNDTSWKKKLSTTMAWVMQNILVHNFDEEMILTTSASQSWEKIEEANEVLSLVKVIYHKQG